MDACWVYIQIQIQTKCLMVIYDGHIPIPPQLFSWSLVLGGTSYLYLHIEPLPGGSSRRPWPSHSGVINVRKVSRVKYSKGCRTSTDSNIVVFFRNIYLESNPSPLLFKKLVGRCPQNKPLSVYKAICSPRMPQRVQRLYLELVFIFILTSDCTMAIINVDFLILMYLIMFISIDFWMSSISLISLVFTHFLPISIPKDWGGIENIILFIIMFIP